MNKRYLMNYCKNWMTDEEYLQAQQLFHDNKQLIYFVVSAYNRHIQNHKEVKTHLIVNPEALFVSYDEEKQFINELKQYVRDVIAVKQREDSTYGNTNSQATDNPTA